MEKLKKYLKDKIKCNATSVIQDNKDLVVIGIHFNGESGPVAYWFALEKGNADDMPFLSMIIDEVNKKSSGSAFIH